MYQSPLFVPNHPSMSRMSTKNLLLEAIYQLEVRTAEGWLKKLTGMQWWQWIWFERLNDSPESIITITPLTTISSISPFSDESNLESDSESTESDDLVDLRAAHYNQLLDAIWALHDEVSRAHILNQVAQPLMCASQLHLLQIFADFWPHLFHKKVCVDPEIFDCILDEISTSPVFTSKSNNL